jgi:hypothetical protein
MESWRRNRLQNPRSSSTNENDPTALVRRHAISNGLSANADARLKQGNDPMTDEQYWEFLSEFDRECRGNFCGYYLRRWFHLGIQDYEGREARAAFRKVVEPVYDEMMAKAKDGAEKAGITEEKLMTTVVVNTSEALYARDEALKLIDAFTEECPRDVEKCPYCNEDWGCLDI